MSWLPMYVDEVDALVLLTALNDDPEIAFIVSDGAGRWIARERISSIGDGPHCLWHIPSGPLTLIAPTGRVAGLISDPWSGWIELTACADPRIPFFGVAESGIIRLHLVTKSPQTGGIGLSSFGWVRSHYGLLGYPAHPSTDRWWRRLKSSMKKHQAVRVPRTGSLSGPEAEIWALPSARAKIGRGIPRDENP